jgi:hypothetical protein
MTKKRRGTPQCQCATFTQYLTLLQMGDGGTRERRNMLVTLAVDIGSTATKVHA